MVFDCCTQRKVLRPAQTILLGCEHRTQLAPPRDTFAKTAALSIGYLPDGYGEILVTNVPPEKVREVARALDPDIHDGDVEANLERDLGLIARVNQLANGISDIEVVIMDRDRETVRREALLNIQIRFPGLIITEIKDGTFMHGVLAAAGWKGAGGKHKVLWTVGGEPEAADNVLVAAALTKQGAVANMRPDLYRIVIAGLMCFFVGIVISLMLIGLATASLYHAISSDDDNYSYEYP